MHPQHSYAKVGWYSIVHVLVHVGAHVYSPLDAGVFLLDLLLQHLLRLVDLGREIRAAPAVRVVQQHELAVLLAQELLGDAAFAAQQQLASRMGCLELCMTGGVRIFLCSRGRGRGNIRHLEDERCLLSRHLGLEPALVEAAAQRAGAGA